ncbi:MAG: GNAT family N-acetyltransferase [Candidatus Izemoplasmatales bacterium]
MNIIYKDFNILSENEVKNLYEDAGWTVYTKNIKNTLSGIQNSSFVYSAWYDSKLIGLIRVLSDDHTVCFIQDLVVMKAFQNQGIGQSLLNKVLEKYQKAHKIVLLTDQNGPHSFYRKLGFQKALDLDIETYTYIQK